MPLPTNTFSVVPSVYDQSITEDDLAAALPVSDATSIVHDPTISTRRMRIDVGAVTAGQTRVLTMPDSDVSLPTNPIGGSTGATDNALLRADGTGGSTAQATNWNCNDSDNLSLARTVTGSTETLLDVTMDLGSEPRAMLRRESISLSGLAAAECSVSGHTSLVPSTAAGGQYHAIQVDGISGGAAALSALKVCGNVAPLVHRAGAAAAATHVFTFDASLAAFADITAASNIAGDNEAIFVEVNDIVYVGSATLFDAIESSLGVLSSVDCVLTYGYSDGAGGFTACSLVDGTRGMTRSGLITFDPADLAGWALDTVNGQAGRYWIRLTRNRGTVVTPPQSATIRMITGTAYGWDASGDITCATVHGFTQADLELLAAFKYADWS